LPAPYLGGAAIAERLRERPIDEPHFEPGAAHHLGRGGVFGDLARLEGREIPIVHGCRDRLLHQMVARDESRVRRTHRRPALVRLATLLRKPMAPSRRPIVEGARIGRQAAYTGVAVGAGSRVAQPAEDQGEIRAIAGHAVEEVLR
jgi:hypothetical protein